MSELSLETSVRTALGKKNRRLRRMGLLPLHIYGLNMPPLSLQAEADKLATLLKKAGRTHPIRLQVEGGDEESVLLKEVAVHPSTGDLLHADFIRITPSKPVDVYVPVKLLNTDIAPIARGGNANITQNLHSLHIRCVPFEIPSRIEVDCSALDNMSGTIKAFEVELPENATLLTDPNSRVLFIQISRAARSLASETSEGEELDETEDDS